MDRRSFLRALGLGAAAIAAPSVGIAGEPARKKPNILFLFADDQSFEALHALGCGEIHTPNLDRVVRNGVTFTHAYNPGAWHGAVCVASRTMLNTGRFLWDAQRIEPELDGESAAGRIWGQYLSGAGYATYFSGKWHVKTDPGKAFQHVSHVRPGMPNQTDAGYNRPIEGQPDVWHPWDTEYGGYWKGGKHWSEVLGDDAVRFIGEAAGAAEPFFMYLAFNAPHDPRQSPKEYVDRYPLDGVAVPENYLPEYPYKDAMGCGEDLRDERLAPFPRTPYAVKVHRQEYYAIVTHMDAQVGRILDALEASGEADDTYVFFTADHGLAVGHHGLMGKQNMYDPSMRVPLMVTGPGIPKNRRIATPVYLQDIMPSTLELAGVEKPEHVRFQSLLPLIAGTAGAGRDAIYGAYMDLQRMVCAGGYKLIYYPRIDKTLLFDLEADPEEINDLAGNPDYAGKVAELRRRLEALQADYGDELALSW
ncbi:MAG: sulfatase-like hydrolase/transferase [Candidatus Hydrogenedentes bacterium]|nr:sulfatase-like hydrolase/transferase [Candidatus Hydrogenedentota bacterium]